MKRKPSTQAHSSSLSVFRQQVYALFANRRDVLFELLDAIVQTPQARSFAELSLASACTRQCHSLYKALQQGIFDVEGLRQLGWRQLPKRQHLHFAVDVMSLRRMHSETLQERCFCHGAQREVGGTGVIVGLPYSLLSFVDQRFASWAPTLHTQRIRPFEKAVTVAVEQLKWLAPQLADEVAASIALDGSYGNLGFFSGLRGVAVVASARMRDDRVMYCLPAARQATAKRPRGRPPKYGAKFSFAEPATWPEADEVLEFDDESYGQVRMQLWKKLRFAVAQEIVDIAVVRCAIHLDKPQPAAPQWYGVHNGTTAETTLASVFACLSHRWAIEPANRFRKERLYADLPKVRQARASDVWMMLLQVVEWELYLWRTAATDERLPWQKPLSLAKLPPARVLRSLANNLSLLGCPVAEVLPRGKSPGWQTGRVRQRPVKYKLESKRRKKLLAMSKNE